MTHIKKILSIGEIRKNLNPLLKEEELRLVLLFGSVATGKTHKKSDIDLAFLFNRPVNILALTNKIIRLLHTDNVDVVDLRRANPLLKFSIAKGGLLIYEREQGMFNEFYSLAFRMYIDTKKLRDAQATVIAHFLKARGLL